LHFAGNGWKKRRGDGRGELEADSNGFKSITMLHVTTSFPPLHYVWMLREIEKREIGRREIRKREITKK
jgi:hypothetical protein